MTQPQIKTEPRINAYEGMKVETVKQQGSTGQKIAVSLFDENRNGILEKDEAELFNNYNFTAKKNEITMYDKANDRTLQIKYNSLDELYDMYKGKPLNCLSNFFFGKYMKNGQQYTKHSFGRVADYKKITIDMPNAKVNVEGASGSLYGRNIDLTVSNSDCDEIYMNGGTLNLKNVKDEGLLWDSSTDVKTDGKTKVEKDANTKAEISTRED